MPTTSPRSLLLLGECPMALPTALHRAGQGRVGVTGFCPPAVQCHWSRTQTGIPEVLSLLGSFCATGSQALEGQSWPHECCPQEPLPTLLHSWGDSAQQPCQVQVS